MSLGPVSYVLAKKGLKKPDSREAIRDFFAPPFWDNIPDKPPLIKSNSVRNLFVSTSEPSPESVGDLWIRVWLRGGVWPYKQKITLTNNTATDLTDFQVRLELDASKVGANFRWDLGGKDLRFYTAGGQKIPYWVESWDETNKQAVIWVKVPSIPANGSTTVYMYYGNPSAESESNGDAVFEFFDDFTPLQKAFVVNPTPVIEPTTSDESQMTRDPSVLYLNGTYHMWYWDGDNDIWYVYSSDGVRWTKVGKVLTNAHRPCVVYKDGTYYMYYEYGGKIRLATSTRPDGGFTDKGVVLSPSEAWEDSYLWVSSVIYDGDEGKWKMWYSAGEVVAPEGYTEPKYIGYAESTDGVNWTKNPDPILSPNSHFMAFGSLRVVKMDGTYYGFIHAALDDGRFRMFFTTSNDGISWRVTLEDKIIDLQDLNEYGVDHIYVPAPLYVDGKWRVWFNARDGSKTNKEVILLAEEAENVQIYDASKWTRVRGGIVDIESNSVLSIEATDEYFEVYSNTQINTHTILEAKVQVPNLNGRAGIFGVSGGYLNSKPFSSEAGISNIEVIFLNENGEVRANQKSSGSWGTERSLTTYSANTYYILSIERASKTRTIYKAYDISYNLLGSAEFDSSQPDSLYFGIYAQNIVGTTNAKYDWVRVRKYAEQEPSVVFGAEEEEGPNKMISLKLWDGSEWVGNIETRSIYPEVDNTYNCGSPSSRWKNVYAVNVQTGDVVFQNGWRITEFDENGKLMDGLRVLNKGGVEILRIAEDGLYFKGKKIGGGE